jgi:hypothetical protein
VRRIVPPLLLGGIVLAAAAAPAAAQVQAVKCRDCHPDIYAEWKASQHAKAWSDPRFQAALKVAEEPERCTPCHAPNPILDAGIGVYPTLRSRYKTEGVTCVTCHQKGDAYAGPFPAKQMDDTGHYSVEEKAFKDYTLCATCHGQEKEQVHNQVRDYLQGPSAKKGKHCQECHMPRVVRPVATDTMGKVEYQKRPGRKHVFVGSHDEGMLKKAAKLELKAEGGKATATVTNVEAAHAIPAAADRALRVEFEVTPTGGTPAVTLEVWGWDKRLLEGKSAAATATLPAGGGKVRATLWHCFARDDKREDWAKMAEAEATWR